MPLLMCPNCQNGMKEINREGVQIDMCPSCHGIWLDRGELQKLLDVTRQDFAPAPPPPAAPYGGHSAPYPPQHQHHQPHYQQGKYRKKNALESIFDIFD